MPHAPPSNVGVRQHGEHPPLPSIGSTRRHALSKKHPECSTQKAYDRRDRRDDVHTRERNEARPAGNEGCAAKPGRLLEAYQPGRRHRKGQLTTPNEREGAEQDRRNDQAHRAEKRTVEGPGRGQHDAMDDR